MGSYSRLFNLISELREDALRKSACTKICTPARLTSWARTIVQSSYSGMSIKFPKPAAPAFPRRYLRSCHEDEAADSHRSVIEQGNRTRESQRRLRVSRLLRGPGVVCVIGADVVSDTS